jgi:uncharacterized protein (TIGR03000 family)
MTRNWLLYVLGAVTLGALPGVGSAQSSPVYYYGYSPYYYFRHGSYWEPNMYGTAPGDFRGSAAYLYGDQYSPYDYLRHGTYSFPSASRYLPRFGIPDGPMYRALTPPTSAPAAVAAEAAPADNRAFVQVRVPANAEIWFEGDKTTKTGPERAFTSPALEPGRSFTYDIRARWTDSSGKVTDETRQVKVQAGRTTTVDFGTADTSGKR